jgi:hypothetical protein
MVWGGNTVPGRSDLHVVAGRVTGQYYRDFFFSLHAVPSACFYDHCFILKDLNARFHKGRIVTDYLQQQNISTMPWPALSLDFSPIKNIWDMLGKWLRQCS